LADWIRRDVPAVTEVTLTPSSGGAFEITVGEKRVFSKLQLRRFPDGDEAIRLVREAL
jgi:selenoprotein W-related protein